MAPEHSTDSELSLRQRKKLQSKRRIKSAALHLIEHSPYDEVTVEQIAVGAEVSPSTVYRHFGTKEGIFLWDEYDEAVIEEFEAKLADTDPISAMTEAMADILAGGLDDEIDRAALAYVTLVGSVPQLKQAMAVQIDEIRRLLTERVAASGWPKLDSAVFAGAIVGTFIGALEAWLEEGASEPLAVLLGRATDMIVRGFGSVFDEGGSAVTRPEPGRRPSG